jgi:hypothetical protein
MLELRGRAGSSTQVIKAQESPDRAFSGACSGVSDRVIARIVIAGGHARSDTSKSADQPDDHTMIGRRSVFKPPGYEHRDADQ